ncbi:MAG TPA: endonuclease domain-containing protein, partial [Rhodanobacteraceae bacterium]|nr:endonuclease domain-containing protein [Rhodanobacteraceae bacterium]
TAGVMKGQTNRTILAPKLQRRLRNAPTDAEHVLWQSLRGRQIENCKVRRQHPFADYILDFVCLERALIVELDGGQHAVALDAERTLLLEKAGFAILRFWNNDVFANQAGVLETIQQSLIARATPSPPNPPPEGEA